MFERSLPRPRFSGTSTTNRVTNSIALTLRLRQVRRESINERFKYSYITIVYNRQKMRV